MPDSVLISTVLIAIVLVTVIGALLATVVAQRTEINRLRRQLQAVRQLTGDAAVAGLALDPRITPAMIALVQQGRVIEAIKAFREATGARLAEAKDAIDEIPRPGR